MQAPSSRTGRKAGPLASAAGELCTQLRRLQELAAVDEGDPELAAVLVELRSAWGVLETLGTLEGTAADTYAACHRERPARVMRRTPAPALPAAIATDARLRTQQTRG